MAGHLTTTGIRQVIAQRGAILAAVAIVALIGSALVLMVLSYTDAVAAHEFVARARERDTFVQRAEKYYWRDREAMNEYLLTRTPALLSGIEALDASFHATIAELRTKTVDRASRVQLRIGLRARRLSEETFERFRRSAGRGSKAENRAILALQALEPQVIGPLEAVGRLDNPAEEARSASARADGRRALVAGVFAALVALVGGIAFAVYAVRLVRRIRAQNDRLVTLDRVKDDFVASVSHELRTPLTSIRGYLELVLDEEAGALTAEQRQFLLIVERNADRLQRVVGDLLFVAQVDAGKIQIERAPTDIADVVREAVEAARPAAAERRVELDLELDGLGVLDADRARLAQVVDNLISNAIKFTSEGGRVAVRSGRRRDCAVLEVADTGIGIPHAEQKRMFQRFFRTREATERAIQGTGLGLTIVKAIVEAHDGTITFRSVPGVGTTFRVELPFERERIAA